MADSTLGNLTAATAATGGLFYGTQAGADRKFTLTAAGAALGEAADAAAQITALGAVAKSTYDANSILVANTDNTPIVLVVAEQRLIGRTAGGNIDDLTPAEVRSIINAVYAVGSVGAGTLTLNAANGVVQTVTITGAITLAAPSNPVAGMEMSIAITASGGAQTITLGSITVPTGYTFSGSVASGSVRRLRVYYTGSAWLLTSNLEFA